MESLKQNPKFYAILMLLILCSFWASAQNPTFQWGKSFGSLGRDFSHSVCRDKNGNVFTTGSFHGTTDFDPGAGTFNLTAVGGYDCFIQKLDSNGNFIWAAHNGGFNNVGGNEIITDLQGNVYIIGEFEGSVNFSLGSGINSLTAFNQRDIFIQKLDENGNLIWLKHIGGFGDNQPFDIALDTNKNIYIIGSFSDTVDFNPDSGVYNMVSNGNDDVFVEKLDSNGTFIWVKQMGGKQDDQGTSIVVDGIGDLILSGRFADTADYNPGPGVFNLISNGDYDAFVVKLNSNGGFIWANQIGGISIDPECSISKDANNNIYVAGGFNGTTDLDPGTGTINYTSVGSMDVFVQKLSPTGNLMWVEVIASQNYKWANSIHSDAYGNLYLTGGFIGSIDFDPGSGTDIKTSLGQEDVFIYRMTTSGNYLGVSQFGGPGNDTGFDIEADENGNIYTVGLFQNMVDFDPGNGVTNLTSVGSHDIFIHKMWLESVSTNIFESSLSNEITVYPNPTNGNINIEFNEAIVESKIKLFSSSGEQLLERANHNQPIIQLSINQPSGVYIIEIQDNKGGKAVYRIIKE